MENGIKIDYCSSKRRKSALWLAGTFVVLLVTTLLSMTVGNYHIDPGSIIGFLFGGELNDEARYALLNVRVPRIFCCIIVGASLSCAGLVMQSLFKNPMASPSILGISSGAAFGASLALAFGVGSFLGDYMVPGMAFIFCLMTMFVVYQLGKDRTGVSSVTLLLSGVAIGSFFSGLVSLLQYIVDVDVLSSIVYWTLGSFNACGWMSFRTAIVPVAVGLVIFFIFRRELNMISAGDEQAANMGVDVDRLRIFLMIGTAFVVGGSVAISGVIGFVGLIVPHIFRMVAGPDHRLLMPLCVMGGGVFMVIMDIISKTVLTISIPVGILTSLLGAPFFIFILKRRKRDAWQ